MGLENAERGEYYVQIYLNLFSFLFIIADLEPTLSKFYWEISPCIKLIDGENPDSRSTINLSFHINIFILFNLISPGFFSWNNSIYWAVFQQIINCLRQKVPRTDQPACTVMELMRNFLERSNQIVRVSASCRDQVNYSEQSPSSW